MDSPSRPDVRRTYDRIGEHFAQTRAATWPEIDAFCEEFEGDQAVALGSGNGRHVEPLAEQSNSVVAVDLSRTMLLTARNRIGPDVHQLQADVVSLPLRSNTMDLGLYVATVHHLPSEELRARSLAELARILVPDGPALVSAWATTHDRFDETEGFDTTVEWTLPDGTMVDRFYHIVDPAEFTDLLDRSPLTVDRCWTASGNCYAIVRGPSAPR